ncbi:hypothetical protein SAMN06298226_2114 [Nitrosovibrio sp. Nv4]|nr:hypothetical protein SAMN06298226_2114 [Nitrosovibrio sp. Nv4]
MPLVQYNAVVESDAARVWSVLKQFSAKMSVTSVALIPGSRRSNAGRQG